jgi:hypothetical protein
MLGSKRTSFVASVPTTLTMPVAGFTPSAMHRFIRRSRYVTVPEAVSITATSWSLIVHPARRPVSSETLPLMRLVQLPPLSSSHCPAAFWRTICATPGGGGSPASMGGSKPAPELGGGFCPP